jgi:hypothetical protein
MLVACGSCSREVSASPEGRLPPWCPGCGADLKPYSPDRAPAAPAQAPEPAPVRFGSAHASQYDGDPVGPVCLPPDEQLNDRLGFHNFAVGVLLAAWGFVQSSQRSQSTADKLLDAHEGLNAALSALQIVTLLSGAALVVSGAAIRRRQAWGYALAGACGVVSLVAGAVFFAGFSYLGKFQGLEHAVARTLFIRNNFDMILGFVDGLGLLVFLYRFRGSAGSPGQDRGTRRWVE